MKGMLMVVIVLMCSVTNYRNTLVHIETKR